MLIGFGHILNPVSFSLASFEHLEVIFIVDFTSLFKVWFPSLIIPNYITKFGILHGNFQSQSHNLVN